MVRHLSLLQVDPIAAIAPSVDLVAWSRWDRPTSPGDLRAAPRLPGLIEHQATIRTADHLAALRAVMADWPGRGELRDWQKRHRDWETPGRSGGSSLLLRCGSPCGTATMGRRERVRWPVLGRPFLDRAPTGPRRHPPWSEDPATVTA